MWFFRKKRPGEKIRNPIQGEFFATEAIDGPAQALIRESIQNSLDASTGELPVRLRIMLATGTRALPAEEVGDLFEGVWPHYAASGNGLREAPTPESSCPYLVVEDFGTRGLTGDPSQADYDPAVSNPFYLFFRAEGLSAKSGTELGRWGVGKFVFPRSSSASTHFGLTVRHDDCRRLLLGAVTLKAHRVDGDPSTYTPDGMFGHLVDEDFVMPMEDANFLDQFCRLFKLSRTTEPGLSVVVPFVDSEITFERLLLAAIKDYFLPIIHGRLEIRIESEGADVSLNAASLDGVLDSYRSALGSAVVGHVVLAKWATTVQDMDRVMLAPPDPARAARWSDSLVPPAALAQLREKLSARSSIAVRVPVTVRSKKNGSIESFFDIYLSPDRGSDGRPLFVREGIIVSDVRGTRAREIHSLVVIEDRPLAALLGDSENPAHTQWQKDSSNFRGLYTYGPGLIDFVSHSVGELLAIVTRSSEEADPSLTVDFFSIEMQDDEESADSERKRKSAKKGEETADPPIDVAQRPTRILLRRHSGGFTVTQGSAPPAAPYLVELRCAYDIRSGNPLKKWHQADFIIGSASTPVHCDGPVSVKQAKGNWLLVQVDGPEFHVSVSGFDLARDLYVRADVREPSHADSQN